SASEDQTIKLWDVEKRTARLTLTGHKLGVYALATSPDGKTLATGSGDWHKRQPAEVRFWDIATGQETGRPFETDREVWGLAYTRDGKQLAAALGNGRVKVWDLASGRTLNLANAPMARPILAAPGGRLVATGQGLEENGTARLWDPVTWTERAYLPGHQKIILGMDFSPDGQRLATASKDGT